MVYSPEKDAETWYALHDDHTGAGHQFKKLVEEISAFEKTLDDNYEIALKIGSFGEAIIMNVTAISYHDPSLIIFSGYVNENRTKLIQHINQLSFFIMAVKKSEPTRPARRIGFDLSHPDK